MPSGGHRRLTAFILWPFPLSKISPRSTITMELAGRLRSKKGNPDSALLRAGAWKSRLVPEEHRRAGTGGPRQTVALICAGAY